MRERFIDLLSTNYLGIRLGGNRRNVLMNYSPIRARTTKSNSFRTPWLV